MVFNEKVIVEFIVSRLGIVGNFLFICVIICSVIDKWFIGKSYLYYFMFFIWL